MYIFVFHCKYNNVVNKRNNYHRNKIPLHHCKCQSYKSEMYDRNEKSSNWTFLTIFDHKWKFKLNFLTPSFAFSFSRGDALEKMKKVAKITKINAIDFLAMLIETKNVVKWCDKICWTTNIQWRKYRWPFLQQFCWEIDVNHSEFIL